MGWLGTTLKALGWLVVLLLAVAGIAYAFDMKLAATVRDTRCGQDQVDLETRMLGIDATVDVPRDQCVLVSPGNFVEYRIRSGRTTVYEREGGACVYDTATGPGCGRDVGGGGILG